MFRKLLDFLWTGMSLRDRYRLKVLGTSLVVFMLAALALLRFANDLWNNTVLLSVLHAVVMFAMVSCANVVATYVTWLKYGQFDDD